MRPAQSRSTFSIKSHTPIYERRQQRHCDSTQREGAQAKIRIVIKRILRRFGYPPDLKDAGVKKSYPKPSSAPTGRPSSSGLHAILQPSFLAGSKLCRFSNRSDVSLQPTPAGVITPPAHYHMKTSAYLGILALSIARIVAAENAVYDWIGSGPDTRISTPENWKGGEAPPVNSPNEVVLRFGGTPISSVITIDRPVRCYAVEITVELPLALHASGSGTLHIENSIVIGSGSRKLQPTHHISVPITADSGLVVVVAGPSAVAFSRPITIGNSNLILKPYPISSNPSILIATSVVGPAVNGSSGGAIHCNSDTAEAVAVLAPPPEGEMPPRLFVAGGVLRIFSLGSAPTSQRTVWIREGAPDVKSHLEQMQGNLFGPDATLRVTGEGIYSLASGQRETFSILRLNPVRKATLKVGAQSSLSFTNSPAEHDWPATGAAPFLSIHRNEEGIPNIRFGRGSDGLTADQQRAIEIWDPTSSLSSPAMLNADGYIAAREP